MVDGDDLNQESQFGCYEFSQDYDVSAYRVVFYDTRLASVFIL